MRAPFAAVNYLAIYRAETLNARQASGLAGGSIVVDWANTDIVGAAVVTHTRHACHACREGSRHWGSNMKHSSFWWWVSNDNRTRHDTAIEFDTWYDIIRYSTSMWYGYRIRYDTFIEFDMVRYSNSMWYDNRIWYDTIIEFDMTL